jgi:hypothetical protein
MVPAPLTATSKVVVEASQLAQEVRPVKKLGAPLTSSQSHHPFQLKKSYHTTPPPHEEQTSFQIFEKGSSTAREARAEPAEQDGVRVAGGNRGGNTLTGGSGAAQWQVCPGDSALYAESRYMLS